MTQNGNGPDPMHAVGERWFADTTSFADDMVQHWGDWGVDSEYGRLEAVLLRRPGAELEQVTDPSAVRFRQAVDPQLARQQHDQLAELYRSHGVKVHYIEQMAPDRPNGMFVRDLVAMTPEGAILARPAMAARRGEERYAAQALSQLGVPILKTVNGSGTFEGADLMWVDPETVFLGLGNRSNRQGLEQVERELRAMGVAEVIYLQIPYGWAHIDGLINIIDSRTAVCFPWQTPFVAAKALKDRGFEILEIANVAEMRSTMPVNFVALAPGVIVMAAGSPTAAAMYRAAGIEVLELDISELMKAWGAVHCLTGFLKRESVRSGSRV